MKFRNLLMAIWAILMMALLTTGCATHPMGVAPSTPVRTSLDEHGTSGDVVSPDQAI